MSDNLGDIINCGGGAMEQCIDCGLLKTSLELMKISDAESADNHESTNRPVNKYIDDLGLEKKAKKLFSLGGNCETLGQCRDVLELAIDLLNGYDKVLNKLLKSTGEQMINVLDLFKLRPAVVKKELSGMLEQGATLIDYMEDHELRKILKMSNDQVTMDMHFMYNSCTLQFKDIVELSITNTIKLTQSKQLLSVVITCDNLDANPSEMTPVMNEDNWSTEHDVREMVTNVYPDAEQKASTHECKNKPKLVSAINSDMQQILRSISTICNASKMAHKKIVNNSFEIVDWIDMASEITK